MCLKSQTLKLQSSEPEANNLGCEVDQLNTFTSEL